MEDIMLSEVNQAQKHKGLRFFSHMWEIDTNGRQRVKDCIIDLNKSKQT
jgi:hypothetical protein